MPIKIYSHNNEDGLFNLMEKSVFIQPFEPFMESIGFSFEIQSGKELKKFRRNLSMLNTQDMLFRITLDGLVFEEFCELSKALIKLESEEPSFAKTLRKSFDYILKKIDEIPDSELGIEDGHIRNNMQESIGAKG